MQRGERRTAAAGPQVTPNRLSARVRRQQQLGSVVETAARLFARNGFGHTGVAELCAELGMGRGQLYNLIRSKENLLKLVHDRLATILFDGAARVEAMDLPPAAHLRCLIRELVQAIADHHDYVWVFFNEWRALSEANRAGYRTLRREYWDRWERVLQDGIAQGEFEIAEPRLAVGGILGMAIYSYQWLNPHGPKTPAEVAALFSDTILQGIQARPAGRRTSRREAVGTS